jgi:4-amino-4-deoxy-L-arabinose transferase-like glycosyltransferase
MSSSISSPDPANGQPRTAVGWAYRLAVLALLLLIAGEIVLSNRRESQTFDEADHLYAGYEYWIHGDFGRNPEHPPLAKLVAALAILPLHPKEPAAISATWFKTEDFWTGSTFLYGQGEADSLLARARGMMLLFPLGLALAVFAAGREMFGPQTGIQTALLALTLFAFEPMLLANGGLITTDMALSCTLFCSVYAFYRYVKRPSALRLALCALATGLTLAAKQSGVFLFPILAALAIGEVLLNRAHPIPGEPSAALKKQAVSLTLALAAIAIVSYAVLWAFYGFRYAARPAPLEMLPGLPLFASAIPSNIEQAAIFFCARHHLLPEAYLFGWADILQLPGLRVSFLLGKLYRGRQWFIFPALFLIKTTIPLLILLALAPFARLWRRRREFLFLALPAAIYLLIAIGSGMNGQARYILPIYPFLILLASAAAWEFARRSRSWAIAIAGLVVFAAASSLHAFPDYLAYANEAFGGPANTYRLANDSNADWAQGLKFVKQYLNQNHIADCWFDYGDPAVDPRYYGIPCKPLGTAWMHLGIAGAVGVPETITGTVLISASELNGEWGPDVLNPYDQFHSLRPVAIPGNIVLVYRGTFHVPLASAYSHLAAASIDVREHHLPEALAEAQEAVRLAPDSADIQAGLAQTLTAAGKNAEATQANLTALRLARAVHPEFQQAQIFWLGRTIVAGQALK